MKENSIHYLEIKTKTLNKKIKRKKRKKKTKITKTTKNPCNSKWVKMWGNLVNYMDKKARVRIKVKVCV